MRIVKWLLLLCFIVIFGLSGGILWRLATPLPMAATPTGFTIPAGVGLRQAAHLIRDAGIAVVPWQLAWLGRLQGKDAAIKAGSYEVAVAPTLQQLLDKLTRGDVSQAELVLVEGKTFRDFRRLLDAHPDMRHDSAGMDDAAVLRRIGASEAHPEGLFFPDTYLFDKGSSDLAVLARAYMAMKTRLAAEWQRRDPKVPWDSAYEALIMASIIEKETGIAADRPAVASVFVNRLRRGMLLQTDPTVIYGLGQNFDGNLRKRDLLSDGPYNTYTRPGLPPTPISLPGLDSLRAALHPPASEMLYFVARGDGSSEFSRTLDEHNRAVARFQLRR